LRHITPPNQTNELVTVVEHPAFVRLYQQELAQEGLHLEIVELDRVPATPISIFPDESHKDVNALNIQIPTLSAQSTATGTGHWRGFLLCQAIRND